MKSSIKSLMLVAAVALCLMAVPAFSAPNIMDNKGPGNMGPDGRDMGRFAGHDGPGRNGAFNCPLGDNTSMHKGFTIAHSGEGFAIDGSQYHVLNVNVRGQVNQDPEKFKDIASDNKTLGQIKSDAKAAINAATTYNGSLVFGKEMYVLRNIKWSEDLGENATMTADVAGPITLPEKLFNETDMKPARDNLSKPNETEIKAKFDAQKAKIKAEIDSAPVAGHISMNVTTSDDRFQIGQGQLTLGSTSYNAVLNMGHSMKGIFGKMGHMGMGMMGGHEGMGMMGNHEGMGLKGMGMMDNHNGKMGCQSDMPGENCGKMAA